MADFGTFCSPYTRNLLRNIDATDGLKYWRELGDVFVEEEPSGANSITGSIPGVRGVICNWVTSNQYAALEQEVELFEAGFSAATLDKLNPPVPIYASVWCAARYDCGAKFDMEIKLLNEDGQVLQSDKKEKIMEDDDLLRVWHKVETIFMDYKPGVRRILFRMGGVDTKYWAGNYGAKFTLPCVRMVSIN